MMLHDVNEGNPKRKLRKRVGRGPGSGHGKTSGRGQKGQKSRAGWSQHPVFQGGAMPMIRRIPKRGFNNKFALTVATINVSELEQLFEAGAEVSPQVLKENNKIKSRHDVLKILGNGNLTKPLTVTAHRFSKAAREKIEQAGGTVNEIAVKTTVAEKKRQAKEAAASK
jgi:large subunit ribosomal protein L15